MKSYILGAFALLPCPWLFTVPAFAGPAGRITGFIKDPSGAPVTRATVTAAGATAGKRSAAPDGNGSFEFLELPPGSWTVEVNASGFKRVRIAEVIVEVDQATRVDVELALGDVSETVEVSAITPLLEKDRSTRSAVAGARIIASMPLNGRQYLDLVLLLPGILPAAPGTQGNGFNSAGIRSQSNVYLLDGVSNIDTQTNQPLNSFRITEAVEEFSVQTGVPLPEFGRGAGGQVNIVTRSGADLVHGSAFEYLRNTVLTADDFFTNKLGGPKNALNRNQFGATMGGPIRRGQTFFFVSYEGFRQIAPAVSSVLVPTAAQRATVTDPISRRLLSFYPLPNSGDTLNYISNVRNLDSDNTSLLRFDHRFSARDQLAARWTEYWGSSVAPGPTPLTGGNQGPGSQVSAMLTEEHEFSPRFLQEVRLGYSRFSMQRTVQDAGLNAASIFTGANGAPLAGVVDASLDPLNSGLPSIAVGGGFASLGSNANFPQGRTANTTEVFHNLSLIAPFGASRHSWRWGLHIRREDLSRYLDRSERGSIMFASFSDFARGQIMSSTFRTGTTQAYWRRYPWDLYWQDEFRIRPDLILQYGARYEYPSAIAELRGHAVNFVPVYGPVVAGTNRLLDIAPSLTGAASLIYRAAPFSLPAAGMYTDKNNLAPMFGWAYSPHAPGPLTGDGQTVIRGGFRIAYDDLFNNVPSSMALSAPYNLQTTQMANLTQPGKFAWALAFNQNVPLISNYGQQGPGTPTTGVLTFQGVDPHLKSAYAEIYHLGVQRTFGAFSLEADYQGSSGHDQGVYVDVNQPVVVVRDATRRGPVAPNEQVFPYNHFGQSQIAKSIGNSNYNGFILTAKRQPVRGVFLQASYTVGKSLDYNSSYFGSGSLTGETGAPIDSRNLRIDRARSAFDVRQRFVAIYAIDLPAGPGHRLFGWNLPVSRILFSGWQISGIATVQSGTPFTVVTGGPDTSGFNQSTAGISPDGGNRPDFAKPGPVPQDNGNPDRAFDITWFTPNLAGQDGTVGRNVLTGPALQDFDLAAAKSFPLGSRSGGQTRLEFRADLFNLFNHANFAAPVANMNDANFGKITQTLGSSVATSVGTSGGATGGPRIIQLSLRVRF